MLTISQIKNEMKSAIEITFPIIRKRNKIDKFLNGLKWPRKHRSEFLKAQGLGFKYLVTICDFPYMLLVCFQYIKYSLYKGYNHPIMPVGALPEKVQNVLNDIIKRHMKHSRINRNNNDGQCVLNLADECIMILKREGYSTNRSVSDQSSLSDSNIFLNPSIFFSKSVLEGHLTNIKVAGK